MRTLPVNNFFFLTTAYLYISTIFAFAADAPTPDLLDAATKRYVLSTNKPYDDVVEDIEFAISQNNFRITGRNEIGKAISQRTGNPYPQSVILHFCSLQAAQAIYDINPDYLLHMPCRIAVRKETSSVLIEARLIPENDPTVRERALEVNRMMRRIADYGAE